ncbi:OmpA family protein [Methylomonas sp. AM2-LC]|uniref:OmpA family protein n=1 Tax=Methylomonas sp. AM2-LC TaxID=3153301 RepID=UPI0032661072
MKTIYYLPMTLLAVAVVSGCSPALNNRSVTQAHDNYVAARSNPSVTNQAPLELKDAGDSLQKAESAFNNDDDQTAVDHLAYMANDRVAIAWETANRKMAEIAVADSQAKRDQVRLDARTSEADAANRQVASDKILINELNAKKTERGLMITLGDVLFRTNKAELEPGGMHNVEKLGEFMNQYPNYKVMIEGYTDSTGSHSYNQELSDRRAYSVRTALVDMAINSNRIQTHGYAEDNPVASNATASNRQLNRRVEVVLSDSEGNLSQR